MTIKMSDYSGVAMISLLCSDIKMSIDGGNSFKYGSFVGAQLMVSTAQNFCKEFSDIVSFIINEISSINEQYSVAMKEISIECEKENQQSIYSASEYWSKVNPYIVQQSAIIKLISGNSSGDGLKILSNIDCFLALKIIQKKSSKISQYSFPTQTYYALKLSDSHPSLSPISIAFKLFAKFESLARHDEKIRRLFQPEYAALPNLLEEVLVSVAVAFAYMKYQSLYSPSENTAIITAVERTLDAVSGIEASMKNLRQSIYKTPLKKSRSIIENYIEYSSRFLSLLSILKHTVGVYSSINHYGLTIDKISVPDFCCHLCLNYKQMENLFENQLDIIDNLIKLASGVYHIPSGDTITVVRANCTPLFQTTLSKIHEIIKAPGNFLASNSQKESAQHLIGSIVSFREGSCISVSAEIAPNLAWHYAISILRMAGKE